MLIFQRVNGGMVDVPLPPLRTGGIDGIDPTVCLVANQLGPSSSEHGGH